MNTLLINLFTSAEKLVAFRDGFIHTLALYDSEHKSPLDTISISVPLEHLDSDDDGFFINREDFKQLL